MARASAKLDTIEDQVVWWTKGAQPPQLLADGEVVLASAYNGRLFSAIAEKNQPIAMMWDRQVFDLDGWVVPVGVKDLDAVKAYLYFATGAQRWRIRRSSSPTVRRATRRRRWWASMPISASR